MSLKISVGGLIKFTNLGMEIALTRIGPDGSTCTVRLGFNRVHDVDKHIIEMFEDGLVTAYDTEIAHAKDNGQ